MKVAILTTGDEIMAGNISDTNASWISDRVWRLGHKVVLHIGVGDDETDIIEAIRAAGSKADFIIVSGGLGATVDDITLEAASKFFGRKMLFHEDIWSGITTFFERIGRDCAENNRKQAYMPEGAKALPNRVGTAPGVWLTQKGKEFFFVPGVPSEMKQIFNDSIYSVLQEKADLSGYYEKFLKCFGLPEATFDEMIKDIDLGGARLSFRVSFPEVKIKLVARSDSAGKSEEIVEAAADKIRERLGGFIYGEDEVVLEEIVGNLLKNKGLVLSTAESCTGGYIANRITDISGSSGYFDRGFVTYSNEAKIELLGLSEGLLEKHGAVSKEAAIAMAEGAVSHSKADIAVAVTGIAGPTGGTKEKPVGTVHLAVCGPVGSRHKHYVYTRDRLSFKEIVATNALDMVRHYLMEL